MIEFPVSLVATSSDKLDNVELINGQVIVLRDRSGAYYDMVWEDGIVYRHHISSVEFVPTLPQSGISDMLYVCAEPAGMYVWKTGKFVPVGGSDKYTYTCKGDISEDSVAIQELFNKFIGDTSPTASIKLAGTYDNDNNNVISLNIPANKSVFLDLSNLHILNSSNNSLFLSATGLGKLTIVGLSATGRYSKWIERNGGFIVLRDCTFLDTISTSFIETASDVISAKVQDCTFSISDTTASAILVTGESTRLSVTDCIFNSRASNNSGKAVTTNTPLSKIQINNNYMPINSVLADNTSVDIRFTNMY